MIQSYVLDTSTLLNLLRGKELGQRIDGIFNLRSALHLHTISIVTHAELWVLVERRAWGGDKREFVEKALQAFVTVDVAGSQMVSAYRSIEAASTGIQMGKNDIWIAATALTTGLPMITTDKDFNHLNGSLLRVNYVDPRLVDAS